MSDLTPKPFIPEPFAGGPASSYIAVIDELTTDRNRQARKVQRLNERINLLVRDKTVLLSKVESLEEDQAESDALRERMAELLTGVAKALKGEPGPLAMHDWSDLPAVAAAVVAERDAALERLASGDAA